MQKRLSFRNVTVDFPIYDATSRSLRHRLVLKPVAGLVAANAVGGSVHRDQEGVVIVRALDDISLELADGDRVAVFGHNGSGKTTLLRVAAGIYEPMVGEVAAHGRVMPLFNMMEGLAQDATGLEMIRVRGSVLGLSEREIQEKTPEIVEFCELGEYIDMPVRTYSTGMLVRLMFAITTARASEILIMDEFIGAGDATFFERAQGRLTSFIGQSSVLLVATHSADVALKWCNKAMILHHGRLFETGPVPQILASYYHLTHGKPLP